MKYEQRVKKLVPGAFLEDSTLRRERFCVTIKPGRYAYGRMKSWAWKNAYESIIQDSEFLKANEVKE